MKEGRREGRHRERVIHLEYSAWNMAILQLSRASLFINYIDQPIYEDILLVSVPNTVIGPQ